MKIPIRIATTLCFFSIMLMLISACTIRIFRDHYSGDYPELFTVAVNSLLGARGYSTTEIFHEALLWIVDEDSYGRIMFYYTEASGITTASLLISQSSNDTHVYFYPHFNFVSAPRDELIYERDEHGRLVNVVFPEDLVAELKNGRRYADRNPLFPAWGANCANFVSQALVAGGVEPIRDEWSTTPRVDTWIPNIVLRVGTVINRTIGIFPSGLAFNSEASVFVTDTWNNANAQFNYFSNPDNGFINGDVITFNLNNHNLPGLISETNIQVGDLLFMDFTGAMPGNERRINHATIISDVLDDDILLAGNTADWFDESLFDLLTDPHEWQARHPYIELHIVRLNDDVFGECLDR